MYVQQSPEYTQSQSHSQPRHPPAPAGQVAIHAIHAAQRHTLAIAVGTAGFAVVTSLIFLVWLSVLQGRQREMGRTVDRMAAVAQEARDVFGGFGDLLTPPDETAPPDGRSGGTNRRTSDQQDRGRGTAGRR